MLRDDGVPDSSASASSLRPSKDALSPAGALDHRPATLSSAASSSSFSDIPTVAITGVGLLPPVDRLVGEHICAGMPGTLRDCRVSIERIGATLRAIVAIIAPAGTNTNKTASILLFALAVTIVNHARRTFFYGAAACGFFALRPDPADDWRLVLARPDVYLEDSLKAAAGWPNLVWMAAGKLVWDGAAQLVVAAVAGAGATHRHRASVVVAAALYMVWLLSAVEYAVAQSSTAVALVWSTAQVAQHHPGLLVRIMLRRQRVAAAAVLLAWQTVYYVGTGLVPMLVIAVRNSFRKRPKPGVLGVVAALVGGQWVLLRYRSRLYIAIETSGLFVFAGCFAVTAGILFGVERGVVAKDDGKEKPE